AVGENHGDRIVGKVLYVDRFGNLVTNIPEDILPQDGEGKTMTVTSGDRRWDQVPFVPSYGYVKPGALLATIGSNHFLELSVNHGDAALSLGMQADIEFSVVFG
ncbi:MAG TPA: SAM-dependent chlorinase/fluorinase, partial [Thermoplasmata archaeon]|nr:SAM-dependent chlorinase/fluorinase [Thermoplasmata archaeon]